ncbi:MAG: MurT ligase domain-containing protein [bacterium]|nr:MurT ligase domain-containing protein [bacterium]
MKDPRYYLSILAGKSVMGVLKLMGRKATSLPGKLAVAVYPELLKEINDRCKKKVLITGTNGKTTTNNIINHIMRSATGRIISNLEGSNMRQGLASAFLKNKKPEYDWGFFEIDEGSFPGIVKYIRPDYVVVTNFFRDQLDRYGEIETTVSRIRDHVKSLNCTFILNADDPFVAQFGQLSKRALFYGVKRNMLSSRKEVIVETRFCPVCSRRLHYRYFNYGHLGEFRCPCGFRNPAYDYYISRIKQKANRYHFDFFSRKKVLKGLSFPYTGLYNSYNCAAALTFCFAAGADPGVIRKSLETFEYKLGRLEDFRFRNTTVKLVLAKNPIGLTQVLHNISFDRRPKALLLLLNDNIADGRDVSWIWDADFNLLAEMKDLKAVFCSGRRGEDMALRIKYAGISLDLIRRTDDDIRSSIRKILKENVGIIYIIPTYTALFETRNVLVDYQKHFDRKGG